jgi:hypothetical protein
MKSNFLSEAYSARISITLDISSNTRHALSI